MGAHIRHRQAWAMVAQGAACVLTIAAAGHAGVAAQQPPAQTPRAVAPIDLTGTWVSVVTEEWRWRMLTPPKGEYVTLPLTDEARKVGDSWDPARDMSEGNACRAYGAIGIMRMPGRFRVTWPDENTLRMDVDAGQQTRLFRFGNNLQRPSRDAGWQGFSVARWLAPGGGDLAPLTATPPPPAGRGFGVSADTPPAAPAAQRRGGSLQVETTNMKPGYLRKNGIPYSENATMTEHFYTHTTPDGNRWLTVTQIVRDPKYLNGDYVSSWHYKREPNDSKFRPSPCVVSPGRGTVRRGL